MLRPYHFLAAALLVLPTKPALADSDFQQWLSVSAKADLSQSIAAQGEIVARFGDAADGLYELEKSVLLGLKLSNTTTIWAGYVHNPTYTAGDFVVMERRARQQITVDSFTNLGPATLSARMRLEQRWRDGVEGVGWRARPYLKAAVPLGGKAAPTLNFTAEPFFNLNTTAFQSTPGLDRLRSAASLSVPVSKTVKLEAGYLNQHRFIRGGQDRGEHALTGSLSLSF